MYTDEQLLQVYLGMFMMNHLLLVEMMFFRLESVAQAPMEYVILDTPLPFHAEPTNFLCFREILWKPEFCKHEQAPKTAKCLAGGKYGVTGPGMRPSSQQHLAVYAQRQELVATISIQAWASTPNCQGAWQNRIWTKGFSSSLHP